MTARTPTRASRPAPGFARRLALCAILATGLPIGTALADPGDDSHAGAVTTREIGRDRLFEVFQSHYGEIKARPEAMRRRLTADRQAMEKEGHQFIKAPKTNKYLNDFLGGCLTKVGPRPKLPFSVNVVASYTKKGDPANIVLANRSGLILISVGALQVVQHPVELAFLLAHEYGHVAMQHPTSPAEYESMLESDASSGAKLAVSAFKVFADDERFVNTLRRRHEDHADFYGIDVLRACGYNTALAFKVLEKVGEWGSDVSVFEVQKQLERQNETEDSSKEGLGGIFKGLGTAFGTGITALTDAETKDTRAHQDRRALLNMYENEYYKGLSMDPDKMRRAMADWRVFKSSTEWAKIVQRYGG